MQLEQAFDSNYKERTLNMKKRLIKRPHEMCIERAQLITDSYKQTKGEPSILRFSKALNYILSNMALKIWDDEFIIGNRTTKYVGAALFPEVRVDTIELDLGLYDTREIQSFVLSQEDKQVIKNEIIPYWQNEEETVKSRFDSYLSPELSELMLMLLYVVDTDITNGIGHFFPGHENMLEGGIDGLLQKCEAKLKEVSSDSEKRDYVESFMIALNGVKTYIQRFSRLAREMAEKELVQERQKELLEISEICQNISEKPPNSFKEALQLVYFTHVIAGIEDGGFAISIGRLDQVLYPYYSNDIEKGIITNEEVQFLIECFYIKLSSLWNYVLHKGIIVAEGPPIAENLTVGGVDREGNDATNELSYMFLEAYKRMQTVQPTFSVRIHEKSPEELIVKTGEAIKAGASIALYNDDVMIPGLDALGYTLEDAREYAPIGCVEPAHPHKTLGSTNATQIDMVKVLELTLNNGTDMFTRAKYGIENSKKIENYEDLWNEFVKQFQYFLARMVDTKNTLDRAISELNPQPFLSVTTDDCIERGIDITKGGAIYNFTTTQFIGLATVADSLAVIKKVVFEEKLLTLDEMVLMLSKNYRGKYREKKGEEWRQYFINKIPKFGNDDDYVDSIAHNVAKMYCEEVLKYTNYRGGKYNPGIYSTAFHIGMGFYTAASADGRKSRDPLSNGVGPTNGMDKNGPTAILNSVMKLENELQTNGNSLILAFSPKSFKIDLFPALLRSYFKPKGGFHVQFNSIGKDILCAAQEDPDAYPGLVVRIAGYSVLFNALSKNAQNDIIERTEY